MADLNLYKTRLTLHGETRKERIISKAKSDLNIYAPSSPSFQNILLDDNHSSVLITKGKSDTIKNIISMPGMELYVGGLIFWKEHYWLITTIDPNDDISTSGTMQMCNHLLKWQDESGNIIEQWCVLERPYSANQNIGEVFITSNKEYKLYMPLNKNTRQLYVDKRFLVDIENGTPLAYIMTGYDGVSKNYGEYCLLICNLRQDEYNPDSDNKELMIANYIPPKESSSFPSDSITSSIIYNGESQIKLGNKKRFEAKFFNQDGDDIEISPVWEVNISPAVQNHIDYYISENWIDIKVSSIYELIGEKIELSLSGATHKSVLTIEVVTAF